MQGYPTLLSHQSGPRHLAIRVVGSVAGSRSPSYFPCVTVMDPLLSKVKGVSITDSTSTKVGSLLIA
jgi:hypothetical protein